MVSLGIVFTQFCNEIPVCFSFVRRDFLTECLFPSPTRPYELPWEQKTIWAIIFGLMMFVAIAGNGIVLWIVTGKRLMPMARSIRQSGFKARIRRMGRSQICSNIRYFLPWPLRFSAVPALYLFFLDFRFSSTNSTGHRSMRTVTNYFLLNLSIADLLMSSLNCVFNFIFMLNSDWPFGSIYCTINNFVANVTVSTSVFTLVAISFDR